MHEVAKLVLLREVANGFELLTDLSEFWDVVVVTAPEGNSLVLVPNRVDEAVHQFHRFKLPSHDVHELNCVSFLDLTKPFHAISHSSSMSSSMGSVTTHFPPNLFLGSSHSGLIHFLKNK